MRVLSLSLITGLTVSGCFQSGSGAGSAKPPVKTTVKQKVGKLSINWGQDQKVKSGKILSTGTIASYQAENSTLVCRDGSTAVTSLRRVCFDNAGFDGCEVASCDVRVAPVGEGTLGGAPVAIRSFKLNFAKNGKFENLQLQQGWVKTMELSRFEATNAKQPNLGQPIFANLKKTNIAGSGDCSLSDPANIGFDSSTPGQERILTGLYFVDDLGINSEGTSTWYSSSMTGAEVSYTGIIPDPPQGGGFAYDVIPTANGSAPMATSSFGRDGFVSSASADKIVSPSFGPGDYMNVIVGFCIKGAKAMKTTPGTLDQPLLYLGVAVTHRPTMVLDAAK